MVIENYYATRWRDIGPVFINLRRTTLGLFFSKFIIWYDKLQINKSPRLCYTMKLVEKTAVEFEKLVQNARYDSSLNHEYEIKSTADIKKFIADKLSLSDEHVRIAFIFKAVILAHQQFKNETLYSAMHKNYVVNKFMYYNTILYHLYLVKGQINPRKCRIIHRFD